MKTENSLPQLLEKLWQEEFFTSPKGISEISQELAAKGYHYSRPSLCVALTRTVQSGFLCRTKKEKVFRYTQKYPISSPSGQRTALFSKYDFHPRIKGVAFELFEDGYYKEAIQNALVEVIDQVKIKSKHPQRNGRELDGDDLMNLVFGCDTQTPKIRFNGLMSSLDRAEQRGIMFLFKGIVGIRDKKAHLNFIQNDPLQAIEYLSLASLLLRLLDDHAK